MTTIDLNDDLVMHLRTLLLEDMHERAAILAKAAHGAHESPKHVGGDDARCAWASCGMQESAAILDIIGWDPTETDRLRTPRAA
jgi:hypothetical protein